MKTSSYISIIALCLLLLACRKEEAVPVCEFQIISKSVKVNHTTAEMRFGFTGKSSFERFLFYSEYPNLAKSHAQQLNPTPSVENEFSCTISNLQPGVTYYYCVQLQNPINYINLEPIETIVTLPETVPEVQTGDITAIGYTSASVAITLSGWGCDTLPKWGVLYSTEPQPEFSSALSKAVYSDKMDADIIPLGSLIDNTTYYVRAFAINHKGTAYGDIVSFSTLPYYLPTVETINYRNVTSSTAIVYGEVVSDGNAGVTQRGICFATTDNPTIADNKVVANLAGKGKYACALTDLQPATTYYVRAFASNIKGESYGQTLTFTTNN